jgi:hypothetical protein
MALKSRLAKLEKIIGCRYFCAQCHDAPIHQICMYDEWPDGTRQLVSGTPPTPCPNCGRIAADGCISQIVVVQPPET